jgi:hypothetical protein
VISLEKKFMISCVKMAHAVALLVEALNSEPEGRGFYSRWCHWAFFIDIILPATLWPPGGSTQPLTKISNKNISWAVKATGTLAWLSYHLHTLIFLKFGSPNFLEPSGPIQTCNWFALPLLYLCQAVGPLSRWDGRKDRSMVSMRAPSLYMKSGQQAVPRQIHFISILVKTWFEFYMKSVPR